MENSRDGHYKEESTGTTKEGNFSNFKTIMEDEIVEILSKQLAIHEPNTLS